MSAPDGNTVGEILRKAREEKKLTIQQAHEETKISVERINALEQDDYGSFPSETYLKGFVKNYATFLGLEHGRLWSMIGGQKAASPAPSRRPAEKKKTRKTKKATVTEEKATVPTWEVEPGFREVRLRSPQILKRIILPLLIVVIVVLTILLIRARRPAERLTMATVTHYVDDGVMTRVDGS